MGATLLRPHATTNGTAATANTVTGTATTTATTGRPCRRHARWRGHHFDRKHGGRFEQRLRLGAGARIAVLWLPLLDIVEKIGNAALDIVNPLVAARIEAQAYEKLAYRLRALRSTRLLCLAHKLSCFSGSHSLTR
jgi:hypothetical protein